jgi:TatD DNase family protein
MQLVDIGANLTHESFRPDFDRVLARAREAGVAQMVVTGASAAGSRMALSLAQNHPGELYATAGVHPHHAVDYDPATDALIRELLSHDEVKAVGETGLDYHRNYSPQAAQISAFEQQLQIAVDCGKPLFLHQRDAHADFMAVLRHFQGRISRAVVHCFTGSREEMHDYLDAGWYIGITGWLCDERRGTHLRDMVRDIPAERLMIETDSPYLLPRTVTPKPSHRRNEPMYLRHIVEELARDRGESVEHTARITTATSRAFFALGHGNPTVP